MIEPTKESVIEFAEANWKVCMGCRLHRIDVSCYMGDVWLCDDCESRWGQSVAVAKLFARLKYVRE